MATTNCPFAASAWALASVAGLLWAGDAAAQAPEVKKEAPATTKAKTTKMDLERKVDILTDEVQKLRERLVIPEKEEYQSLYGLGPAASKAYRVQRGFSVGGYAEWYLERKVNDKSTGKEFNTGDALRYVQYLGYKFTDKLVVNAEIEFEHATTGANWENKTGSVSAEFAYLDYLAHPAINLRFGLLLVPMGFINEIHEPPFFHGVLRPAVEQVIIPTTWRELGLGIFGEPLPGLSYRVYTIAGFDARRFGPTGWRGGRQSGNQFLSEDMGVVGRVDYKWGDLFNIGGSVFYSSADQNRIANVDSSTFLAEGHVQVRYRGFEFRGLGAYGTLSGADALTTALFPVQTDPTKPPETRVVASDLYGWYVEAAYDFWPLLSRRNMYLAPYVRFERYNTQYKVPELPGRPADASLSTSIIEAGFTYKPHPQVVVKLNYRDTRNEKGTPNADALFLGAGFIY